MDQKERRRLNRKARRAWLQNYSEKLRQHSTVAGVVSKNTPEDADLSYWKSQIAKNGAVGSYSEVYNPTDEAENRDDQD